ncbi:M28 family peptidase [Planctomicrobium sp. SH668]|uniref:M28 family peptidase n=1 Tax=Planctomicrobium sp. SH668 TaxID=3448126 RepID=UPI003F5B4619
MNRALLLLVFFFCLNAAGLVGAQDAPAYNGQRAFRYLEAVCAIGPRISGTEGMLRQQELLETHFTELGGQVRYQQFDVVHPQTGAPVRMKNMIVVWNPEATDRILLCCHYDTRPFPDQEPTAALRAKPFIGANDGGSGVAMLMELAHHVGQIQQLSRNPAFGIDFVIFDGEELVYKKTDKYFYGSEYFANDYKENPPQSHRYRCGVLFDMVAGTNATFHLEINSLRYAPDVTKEIWEVAAKMGVKEFVNRRKYEVLDDHLPLNQIAKIATCDIIDFSYPHWHKRNDLPAACSWKTLQLVGTVAMQWLQIKGNSAGK